MRPQPGVYAVCYSCGRELEDDATYYRDGKTYCREDATRYDLLVEREWRELYGQE